jgi:hypothetical protein
MHQRATMHPQLSILLSGCPLHASC